MPMRVPDLIMYQNTRSRWLVEQKWSIGSQFLCQLEKHLAVMQHMVLLALLSLRSQDTLGQDSKGDSSGAGDFSRSYLWTSPKPFAFFTQVFVWEV